MRVEQIMSQPPFTCRPVDSLDTAARVMWENDCGVVAVVADDGRLVGIVTDRDVCMAAYTQGKPLGAIPVSSTMTREVFACHPEESVEAVERLMGDKQVRRLPVIDREGRPLGILSLNDLVRAAASGRGRNGADREVIRTLAAVSQPRLRTIQGTPVELRPNLVAAS